jgi:hypothetical protein
MKGWSSRNISGTSLREPTSAEPKIVLRKPEVGQKHGVSAQVEVRYLLEGNQAFKGGRVARTVVS